MMMVMEVTEAKEGRLMKLDVRNAGMSQETVDDFKEVDRRPFQMLVPCTKGEAKNCVGNPERSGFTAWKQMVSHFDPRSGAVRSVAYFGSNTSSESVLIDKQEPRCCRVPETPGGHGNKGWQRLT